MAPDSAPPARSWLNRTVLAFGLTSFLSDVSHEMATSILPMRLAALGLGAGALGAIEGIADAASGLAKLGGGIAGQRLRTRKRWTAAGYAVTAVGTSALGWIVTAPAIAAARSLAWIGRGFRSPLRDALIADSVEPSAFARAFGVERAGDMIGAVAGPLLALSLLAAGLAAPSVFAVALVPGLLAALCVLIGVVERPHVAGEDRAPPLRPAMPAGFWPLLTAISIFGAGNFSRTFLILAVVRLPLAGTHAGPAWLGWPVILYAAHNAISAVATVPAGALADRFGRRPVLLAGYVAGAGVSLLLAVAGGSLARVAAAFALSGLAIAIEQTVEKACVAELLPASGRSYGLGLLATSNAFSDVVASVGVGLLWDRAGSASAFGAAAACSAVGAVVLVAVSRRRWRPKSPAPSS